MIDDISRSEGSFTPKLLRIRSREKLDTDKIQNMMMFASCSIIFLRGVKA